MMWMRILVLSVTQFSMWAFSPIAFAQQEGDVGGRGRGGRGTVAQASEQEGPEVKCFNVTRSNPTKLADYIGQLYGRGRVVDMPATGKLLFMGTAREIEQVAELLKELDIPDMDTGSEPELTIIPIRHRRAGEVLSNIRQVFSGTPESILRLSADDARSSIIVLCRSSKVLAAVKKIIEELDRPAQRMALEFIFFKADLNPSDEKLVIPDDLQEVANELSRFGRVSLLGRLFADAAEGGHFTVKGMNLANLTTKVEGEVEDATPGEPIRVQLNAEAQVQSRVEKDGGTYHLQGTFGISTTVYLTAEKFVVIGGSPTGLAEGQSVMLAVRATP